MTKKQLIARATELKIVGRWDMTTEQLTNAIAVIELANKPKRRKGNGERKPYHFKLYRLSAVRNTRSLKDEARQVRAMVAAMYKAGTPMIGSQIAQLAIDLGFMKTKSDPAVIFAYYRKRLEIYGLEFVGYANAEDIVTLKLAKLA